MSTMQFDFEAALRLCAKAHRQQGDEATAKLFDAGAEREACRKYYANPENPQSFEDWLKQRQDVIVA